MSKYFSNWYLKLYNILMRKSSMRGFQNWLYYASSFLELKTHKICAFWAREAVDFFQKGPLVYK